MLSRKKTKNEVSKPAEVQGKYVKKETSPLLRSECRAAGDAPHLAPAIAGSFRGCCLPPGLGEVDFSSVPSGVYALKVDQE
jgi:hypothetical protein